MIGPITRPFDPSRQAIDHLHPTETRREHQVEQTDQVKGGNEDDQ